MNDVMGIILAQVSETDKYAYVNMKKRCKLSWGRSPEGFTVGILERFITTKHLNL